MFRVLVLCLVTPSLLMPPGICICQFVPHEMASVSTIGKPAASPASVARVCSCESCRSDAGSVFSAAPVLNLVGQHSSNPPSAPEPSKQNVRRHVEGRGSHPLRGMALAGLRTRACLHRSDELPPSLWCHVVRLKQPYQFPAWVRRGVQARRPRFRTGVTHRVTYCYRIHVRERVDLGICAAPTRVTRRHG